MAYSENRDGRDIGGGAERNAALPSPLDRSKPVWVAPMAGGPSRPELVITAARLGHFAQLAAGYKTAAAMTAEIGQVRGAGVELFGVNLFVPNPHPAIPDAYSAYAQSLHVTAGRLGYANDWAELLEDDDDWDAKIAALLADPVPVVSFTFGLPDAGLIAQLRVAGMVTMQTVTSSDEARRAERAGIDVLVVQSFAAGGHSGVWEPDTLPADIPLGDLIRDVQVATRLPIVAAGGVTTADDSAAALAEGAAAVVVGTAVLRSPESGASALHKSALTDPVYTETTLTRAFTGRPARALVNQFVLDHDAASISGYPALHHLTRPLRQAAVKADDASALNLWAGLGWRSAREDPLETLLAELTPTPPSVAPKGKTP